jgi:hypothetical protein
MFERSVEVGSDSAGVVGVRLCSCLILLSWDSRRAIAGRQGC